MRVLFVPHSLDGAVGGNEREVGGGGEGGGGVAARGIFGGTDTYLLCLASQRSICITADPANSTPPPRAFRKKRSFPKPEPNTGCVRLVCRVDS